MKDKIFITSVNKAIEKAKVTGQLDMKIIGLFNVLRYYSDFSKNKEEFVKQHTFINNLITELTYKYPTQICNYKMPYSSKPSTSIVNTAPTVTGVNLDMGSEVSVPLSTTIFDNIFTDSDLQGPQRIKITLLTPNDTELYYDGILAPQIFEVPYSDVSKLSIVRTNQFVFAAEDIFSFRISDGTSFSNTANFSVEGTASSLTGNQPATIGDNTIYVSNRTTTVLTLDMFTSQLTPPYNDPENDLIDAIRIDEISTANQGQFLYGGIPISEGQIIIREDIALGLFTHVAPNQDAINSDVINFSARDEGSLIWVQ